MWEEGGRIDPPPSVPMASGPMPAATAATAPPLDPPAPIRRADDATAVIRSLGAPPLKGQGALSEQHMAMVVDRAADAAVVLAHVAGLVDMATDDED